MKRSKEKFRNPYWNKLQELQISALKSTRFRGHEMGPFTPDERKVECHSQLAECTKCGMAVCINAKPQPNEIDVGGEAVALNCTAKE